MNYLLLIIISSSLWHMSLSTHECTRTFNPPLLTFRCPSTVGSQVLRLNDLTVEQLDSITSITAGGWNSSTTGPFTSLPINLCFLRKLQMIDFSFNQISIVDPTGSLTYCVSQIVSLNFESNRISQFPSALIYNMPSLTVVNFRQNLLTNVSSNAFRNVATLETVDFSYNQLTAFELWTLEVRGRVDFSYNRITAITNQYHFTQFSNSPDAPTVLLTNNGPRMNLNDGVYEMYNQCDGLRVLLNNTFSGEDPTPTFFTRKLGNLNLGTTQIDCSCDQADILRAIDNIVGGISTSGSVYPLANTICSNNSFISNDTLFLNSSCAPLTGQQFNSTFDFTQVSPRFCKISSSEDGETIPITEFPPPTSDAPTYPHSISAVLNPGICLFTFNSASTMTVSSCTNEVSNSASTMPADVQGNPYLSTITTVIFPNRTSLLPSYLCSLPSREINLNNQAFTTLTDATFPCLDWFNRVTLSGNRITSVNMASGDFQNLNYLDLSANALTGLPHTLLRPSPSSLNLLDLRNNSLTAVDLFLYTLQNITVLLDNNRINGSVIINPENVIVPNNITSPANISFPTGVTVSIAIIDDSYFSNASSCTVFSAIQSFASVPQLRNATLRCTCASFGLKELYQANQLNITDYWNCSNPTQTQSFVNLTRANCPTAATFTTTCALASTGTSIEYTSISFTTVMENSPLSSSSALHTSLSDGTLLTHNTTSSSITFSANGTSFGSITHQTSTTAVITSVDYSTTSTTTSSTTSANATTSVNPAVPLNNAVPQSSSTNIPLIVGLTVGLGGFALLLAAGIGLYFYFKSKSAGTKKKPIKRTRINNPSAGQNLESRVQPRNLRAVKLAPLPSSAGAPLPPVPVKSVLPPANSLLLANPNLTSQVSARGLPVRLDPIRSPTDISPQYPPNSNALNNSSSFRPINNLSASQPQVPKPRTSNLLNTGGQMRP